MTNLKLFIMTFPLVLLGALAWGWGHFAYSEGAAHAKAASTQLENAAEASSAFELGEVERNGSAVGTGFTDADYTRHVNQLTGRIKRRVPSNNFSIVIQKPFVVIGDEPKREVQRRADTTVKWAVDHLKKDFFSKDPQEILEIWLFKDEASYKKHTMLLFNDTPSTPFGYYSPTHKALIMNISTGGGTLVHEIVHPFMEANFPACPPWLNEGLGSLYEQCGEVDGHIHGFTNWRLPALQQAITVKRVPSFKTMTAMNADAFYDDERGTNYAQARYLCYYLQQKGLLVKFYREFWSRQKTDPTGFQSLRKILGEPDMDAFKVKWEKYVMGLKQGYEVTVE